MNTFGFIGMGNMGRAMLNGLLKDFSANQILFTDVSEALRVRTTEETGVRNVPANIELANSVKYIILAVKPQCYDAVLKSITNVITGEKIIISIAPGITMEDIRTKLGKDSFL